MRLSVVGLSLFAIVTGCAPSDSNSLVVVVHSDIVETRSPGLSIRFRDQFGSEGTTLAEILVGLESPAFPVSYGVEPEDPSSAADFYAEVRTAFTVQTTHPVTGAIQERETSVTQIARMEFVPGQVRRVDLALATACADLDCRDAELEVCHLEYGRPVCGLFVEGDGSPLASSPYRESSVPVACDDDAQCGVSRCVLSNTVQPAHNRGMCALPCDHSGQCAGEVDSESHCRALEYASGETGGEPARLATFCTLPCDPVYGKLPNGGCPVGMACDVSTEEGGFTFCRPRGTAASGEACAVEWDCRPGLSCEGSGGGDGSTCRTLCGDLPAGLTNSPIDYCPVAEQECIPIGVTHGVVALGVCGIP